MAYLKKSFPYLLHFDSTIICLDIFSQKFNNFSLFKNKYNIKIIIYFELSLPPLLDLTK